ncbi:MAG: hypothetical protein JOY70_04945 [Acidisphaera sp.]|nr:hypothetical protein [Acidisphaera sp.]
MNTGPTTIFEAFRRLPHPAPLLAACLLAACQNAPAPAPPSARVFAADLSGGAKKCDAPKDIPLAAGKEAEVKVTVGNDGGWCAIAVGQGGKPFAAGLLTTTPAHGTVFIHTVGDVTRIDYTPEARYAGPDSFAVRLVPGDQAIRASVTVNPA